MELNGSMSFGGFFVVMLFDLFCFWSLNHFCIWVHVAVVLLIVKFVIRDINDGAWCLYHCLIWWFSHWFNGRSGEEFPDFFLYYPNFIFFSFCFLILIFWFFDFFDFLIFFFYNGKDWMDGGGQIIYFLD